MRDPASIRGFTVHTDFALIPRVVVLNDLKRRNCHYFVLYFTEFGTLGANYVTVVEVIPVLSEIKCSP